MNFFKSESKIYEIPIRMIRIAPVHPRKNYNEARLNKLANSILKIGVIEPIIVRKSTNKVFELVIGERRLRASIIAGFSKVPCIILNCDNVTSLIYSLIENDDRDNLNIFEIAKAFKKLIIDYCYSVEDISSELQIDSEIVNRYLRLLKLTDDEQLWINEKNVDFLNAEELLSINNVDERMKILNKIVNDKLSVNETKMFIDLMLHPECKKQEEEKHQKLQKFLVKDTRIFINTLNNTIEKINMANIGAECINIDTNDYIEYNIKIPKTPVCDKIA